MHDVSKTIVSAAMPVGLRDELKSLAHAHDRTISAELRRAAQLWINVNASVPGDSQDGPDPPKAPTPAGPFPAGEGR
jgi:hypothetical protein